MATVRNTNTVQYAQAGTFGTAYGDFKYGEGTYNTVAKTSAGQKMPPVSTREI